MAGHTILKIKNTLILMLLLNLISFMAGGTGIRSGIVIQMAGRALPPGLPMIEGEAVIKVYIAEVSCILMAGAARTGKMIGGWLVTIATIL
jgi:hypothetical protein